MRPFGLDNVLVEMRKVGVGHLRRVRTVVGEGAGARQLVLRGIKDSLGVIGGLLGGLLSGGSLAQSRLCLVELGLCPGDVRLRAQGVIGALCLVIRLLRRINRRLGLVCSLLGPVKLIQAFLVGKRRLSLALQGIDPSCLKGGLRRLVGSLSVGLGVVVDAPRGSRLLLRDVNGLLGLLASLARGPRSILGGVKLRLGLGSRCGSFLGVGLYPAV